MKINYLKIKMPLVHDMALELLNNVEKLTQTAGVLDDNMNGLKTEINAFTIE